VLDIYTACAQRSVFGRTSVSLSWGCVGPIDGWHRLYWHCRIGAVELRVIHSRSTPVGCMLACRLMMRRSADLFNRDRFVLDFPPVNMLTGSSAGPYLMPFDITVTTAAFDSDTAIGRRSSWFVLRRGLRIRQYLRTGG
jgi:hypothetical protein